MIDNNKYFLFLLSLVLSLFIICNTSIVAYADDLEIDMEIGMGEDGLISLSKNENNNTGARAWSKFIEEYKGFVVGIAGVGAVSMVLVFIYHFIALGATASNTQARSQAIKGILVSGIATALLGSVSLVTYIFYYAVS